MLGIRRGERKDRFKERKDRVSRGGSEERADRGEGEDVEGTTGAKGEER